MVEPGLDIRLMVSDRASFSLSATYRHITGLVGDEVVTDLGASGTVNPFDGNPAGTQSRFANSYGASYDMLNVGLSFAILL